MRGTCRLLVATLLFFAGWQLPAAVDVCRSDVWDNRYSAPALGLRSPILGQDQGRRRQGGAWMMRLRGGSKGGIKFTGADGETISVRDDGRISKAGQLSAARASQTQQTTGAKVWQKEREKTKSLKRIQGEKRREAKRLQLRDQVDKSVIQMSGKDRVVRQDPNAHWLKDMDGAVPRETLMERAERVAIMRSTSDPRTAKVAHKTARVSRRKGRRTAKHVPLKQQRHEEEREEYLLSGKKEEAAKDRRKSLANAKAALEIVQENAEDPEDNVAITAKDKKLGVTKIKVRREGDNDLVDRGTGNFTLACENLMKIGEQVLAEWTEKRERDEAKEQETLAYLDSKEYQVKKRKQDKHDQKMKAMRAKIKENNMSSKRKKQLKKIGQDRMTISPHLDFEKEASKVSNRDKARGRNKGGGEHLRDKTGGGGGSGGRGGRGGRGGGGGRGGKGGGGGRGRK